MKYVNAREKVPVSMQIMIEYSVKLNFLPAVTANPLWH
jgi:hypothetical protein